MHFLKIQPSHSLHTAGISTRLCRFAATRDDFGRTAFQTVTVCVRVVALPRRQEVVAFLCLRADPCECVLLVMCVPVHMSAPLQCHCYGKLLGPSSSSNVLTILSVNCPLQVNVISSNVVLKER